MYQITIKGEAKSTYTNLAELDGIECEHEFAEFFEETSWSDDVDGGYMDFRYENGKLWTYTEYYSFRLLDKNELEELLDYTVGQWSDGIGEGFEQYPCYYYDNQEIYISPWFKGQEQTIDQGLK